MREKLINILIWNVIAVCFLAEYVLVREILSKFVFPALCK